MPWSQEQREQGPVLSGFPHHWKEVEPPGRSTFFFSDAHASPQFTEKTHKHQHPPSWGREPGGHQNLTAFWLNFKSQKQEQRSNCVEDGKPSERRGLDVKFLFSLFPAFKDGTIPSEGIYEDEILCKHYTKAHTDKEVLILDALSCLFPTGNFQPTSEIPTSWGSALTQ